MAHVSIHPGLRRFTDNRAAVDIAPAVVADILPLMAQQFPALARAIFQGGQLSPYVVVYLEGQPLDTFSDNAPVSETASIEFITSLVGG